MARSGFVVGSLSLLLFAGAALAQAPAAAPVGKVDFATDVLPILRTNCVECHGPDKQRAGMRVDRKSSVMKTFSRRVVPGSSENSFLYHRIMGEFGSQMPPDGALKPAQIAIIKAWIDQGAEWPDALANEIDKPAPDARAVAMVESIAQERSAGLYEGSRCRSGAAECARPGGVDSVYVRGAVCECRNHGAIAEDGRRSQQGANDANATPLMWAVQNPEKTRLLPEHGANVNAKSDDLKTPLMIAARHPGGAAVVRLLLEHGANANPNAKPETESSPLLEAVTAGDAEITELLLQHGADAKAAGETGLSDALRPL